MYTAFSESLSRFNYENDEVINEDTYRKKINFATIANLTVIGPTNIIKSPIKIDIPQRPKEVPLPRIKTPPVINYNQLDEVFDLFRKNCTYYRDNYYEDEVHLMTIKTNLANGIRQRLIDNKRRQVPIIKVDESPQFIGIKRMNIHNTMLELHKEKEQQNQLNMKKQKLLEKQELEKKILYEKQQEEQLELEERQQMFVREQLLLQEQQLQQQQQQMLLQKQREMQQQHQNQNQQLQQNMVFNKPIIDERELINCVTQNSSNSEKSTLSYKYLHNIKKYLLKLGLKYQTIHHKTQKDIIFRIAKLFFTINIDRQSHKISRVIRKESYKTDSCFTTDSNIKTELMNVHKGLKKLLTNKQKAG